MVATPLYTNAAPVPMPISVNMFGLTFTNDAHIRSKNGRPHQSTTGIDSHSSTQLIAPTPKRCISAPPVAISPIVNRNTGMVQTTPTQKRRVISTSSGLGVSMSSADATSSIGSSAIPHFGHAPGLSLMTSGSIGHVHVVVRGSSLVAGGGRLGASDFFSPPI